MTTYSPSQENYRELAHLLARFTSLTQIKTIFYDFTGILLKDDFVYINHSAIEDNLAQLTFSDYAVFPVSRNIQMWGAILCESVNVSKKRLFLSRSYLENLMEQIFDEDTLGKVSVWEPLTSDQVGQINNLHALFHPTGPTHCKQSWRPMPSLLVIQLITMRRSAVFHWRLTISKKTSNDRFRLTKWLSALTYHRLTSVAYSKNTFTLTSSST